MGSFLLVRDRQPEGGSSRDRIGGMTVSVKRTEEEEELKEWRKKERERERKNLEEEKRRKKTADGTMSLASRREIPVFHSL